MRGERLRRACALRGACRCRLRQRKRSPPIRLLAQRIVAGGDDYEILAAVPAARAPAFPAAATTSGIAGRADRPDGGRSRHCHRGPERTAARARPHRLGSFLTSGRRHRASCQGSSRRVVTMCPPCKALHGGRTFGMVPRDSGPGRQPPGQQAAHRLHADVAELVRRLGAAFSGGFGHDYGDVGNHPVRAACRSSTAPAPCAP